jgi:carboxynorspermidine decarboxylase
VGAGNPGEKKIPYRLGGVTCLSGDFIGDYSFDKELAPGDKIIFLDQVLYTMVQNTTFNGVRLPSIYIMDAQNSIVHHKTFGYEDFKGRLS